MTGPFAGRIAVAGVGETPYYKRGTSPDSETKLTLRAIVAACEDAGIDPRDIDGFASYADDTNNGPGLMGGLGTRELRWSSMVWGGGGGGAAGAIGAAAAAIITGQAEIVAVHRTIAEASNGRLADVLVHYDIGDQYLLNAVTSPAQVCALRAEAMIAAGVPRETLGAFARATYFHGSNNPRAQAYGKPLDQAAYDGARRIVEPFGLFDCSRENDVSAALILMSAERARDCAKGAIHLLGSTQGGTMGTRWENNTDYAGGSFESVAARLWAQSGLSPSDVDVVQAYDNFSGPAVSALIDHGFCTRESAGEVLTYENMIAAGGKLPVNTSGGLMAEGNAHGMGLAIEAVRVLRGESSNPVAGAKVCLVTGGAATPLVSSALFGTESAL